MTEKAGETPVPHEAAGWISNLFGAEYAPEASTCSLAFFRKGPADAKKLGFIESFDVDSLGSSVEDFIKTYYGGGKFQLRLMNEAGRYVKTASVQIAGDPKDPGASSAAISREVYGQGGEQESAPGDDRAWALELDPQMLEEQPHLRRLLGEHVQKSEAAQIIAEVAALAESRRADEKSDTSLIATMMKSNTEILSLVLAAALKPDAVPAPAPADPTGSMDWFSKILEQQMKSQDRAHELQMKGQQQLAEQQAKMSSTAMKGYMNLYSEIVRSAAGKDPEEFLGSFPGLLEKVLRPLGSTAPIPSFAAGGAPPAIASGPTHPPQIVAPDSHDAPSAPPPLDLVSDEVLQERVLEQQAQFVRQFIELLRYHMVYQADPELAWDQQMNAAFGSLPPAMRAAIEAWDPETEQMKIREILLSVAGVEPELVDAAFKTAVTAPGAGEWLTEFWDCAPWVEVLDEPETIESETMPPPERDQ